MSNFDRTQGALYAAEIMTVTGAKPGERKDTARNLYQVAMDRLNAGVNPDYQRGIIQIVDGEM
jgi:hypothetical protein